MMAYRYLTSIEKRLNRIEDLFAELLPDVNLEEALASTGTEDQGSTSVPTPATVATPAEGLVGAAGEAAGESISEAVPDEPDGFDWQEDVNELADGMAALSVEPKGTGYLGKYLADFAIMCCSTLFTSLLLIFDTRLYCWSLLPEVFAVLARPLQVRL